MNSLLKTATFPNRKEARLILIKKSEKLEESPQSYRPFSLLNIEGKVLEQLIARRLIDEID